MLRRSLCSYFTKDGSPDQRSELILPKVGSDGIMSFHDIGAKIWNALRDEIQTTFSKSLLLLEVQETFHVSPSLSHKKKFINSSPNILASFINSIIIVMSILSSEVDYLVYTYACDAIGLWADWHHYGNKFFNIKCIPPVSGLEFYCIAVYKLST